MHWYARLGVTAKFLLPIIVAGMIVLAAVMAVLHYVKERAAREAGVNTAKAVAEQVASLRTFYSSQIAPRAVSAGMKLKYDFAQPPGTLPLPATLVKALGENIAKERPGMAIRLYSRYPFPHRAATERYDAFEQQALATLEKDPKTPGIAVEEVNGRRSMRYAVADTMRAACVACHNTHPESPKRD
jgi:methyl-accepting chemotaxis protein